MKGTVILVVVVALCCLGGILAARPAPVGISIPQGECTFTPSDDTKRAMESALLDLRKSSMFSDPEAVIFKQEFSYESEPLFTPTEKEELCILKQYGHLFTRVDKEEGINLIQSREQLNEGPLFRICPATFSTAPVWVFINKWQKWYWVVQMRSNLQLVFDAKCDLGGTWCGQSCEVQCMRECRKQKLVVIDFSEWPWRFLVVDVDVCCCVAYEHIN